MTKNHTPRFEDRVLTLSGSFNIKIMNKAWQQFVNEAMRGQDILDLHDYFDFHRNRKQILQSICNQIIEGKYRPKTPYEIRVEKKLGVCRHQIIPSPDDAVVLQTIVENLAPIIEHAQPSKRAFYSRSHGGPKSELDIDETFPYA